MKYVILLLDTEVARNMTEAEGQAWYAEIGAWYEKGGGGSGKLAQRGHEQVQVEIGQVSDRTRHGATI